MRYIYSFFLLFLPVILAAQVTTDPEEVLYNQPVTIFYNATLGTSGLQGADKVYMHAGVITDESSSSTDWRYIQGNWGTDDGLGLMEKVAGEENLWKISLSSPKAYFQVPDGEIIQKIAMVFRNTEGSETGKDNQNNDIFINVTDNQFSAAFTQPEANEITVVNGENLIISGEASQTATFVVYKEGTLIQEFSGVQTFSFTELLNDSGSVTYSLEATSGSQKDTDTFTAFYIPSSPEAPVPAGVQQGINIIDNTTATLVLSAPGKKSVHAVGNFSNFEAQEQYLMNRDGDLFWITLNDLDPAETYSYYYWVDEEIAIADPYSEVVLDQGNDQYIDANRYPKLPSFPAEAQTDRLTVFSTAEEEYQWQTTDYARPEVTDLVIYELLVRDFDASESFQGVIDRLDYLDSLNITAIQLMPIMEFNGNNSWGYNPTFQTALDKWYGTKNKFKELVDKAHARGIAVILDIALNHQDYPAPYLKLWGEGYGASPDNPYFNVTARHPFNVFSDANHESELTQAWVDKVNRYWLEEYKIDGYRFDLSKGFTQNNTGNDVSAWSSYDASRVELLKRMADQIWAYAPDTYIILEHFADNTEEKELADYGMLLWGNLNHNFSEAVMGYNLTGAESDFSGISYKARGWNNPHLVGYMESHDEERIMYRALTSGYSTDGYSTKDKATALNRLKMANAFMLLTPGPKMLWQFGEYGYDISIEENGRTGKKPMLWEYLEETERASLFSVVSELNHLKTTYEVFKTANFSMPTTNEVRTLQLDGQQQDVIVVGNFSLQPATSEIQFTHAGDWYNYFSGETFSVNDNASGTFSLMPGEFHIFFDQQIQAVENYAAYTLAPEMTFTTPSHTITNDTLALEAAEEISMVVSSGSKVALGLSLDNELLKEVNSTRLNYLFAMPETTDTLTFTASAARNGFTSTKDLVVFLNTTLATEDNTLSSAITLYPNPVSSETIHLTLPQELAGKALSINLINLQGQRYLLKKIQPKEGIQLKLKLPEISAGLYMLEISDGKSMAVKRLILQ